jgi:predicted Zn-dependent peptidase
VVRQIQAVTPEDILQVAHEVLTHLSELVFL